MCDRKVGSLSLLGNGPRNAALGTTGDGWVEFQSGRNGIIERRINHRSWSNGTIGRESGVI